MATVRQSQERGDLVMVSPSVTGSELHGAVDRITVRLL